MQVQQASRPFQIIHNARSHKGSRSRKSSISTHDRERHPPKTKKVRKMTMNPESASNEVIREIEQFNEKPEVKSLKEEVKQEAQEQYQFWRCLELGSTKIQSNQEMELQKGIEHGIVQERQLEGQFRCSRCNKTEQNIGWNIFE